MHHLDDQKRPNTPCIEAYFEARARALTDGHIDGWCSAFRTPITIPVADRNLYIPTLQELRRTTIVYRSNLMVESYDHTTCEILYTSPIVEGRRQVLVQWRHFNTRGALISGTDASHICHLEENGRWRDHVVELIVEPLERIISGMPIR